MNFSFFHTVSIYNKFVCENIGVVVSDGNDPNHCLVIIKYIIPYYYDVCKLSKQTSTFSPVIYMGFHQKKSKKSFTTSVNYGGVSKFWCVNLKRVLF